MRFGYWRLDHISRCGTDGAIVPTASAPRLTIWRMSVLGRTATVEQDSPADKPANSDQWSLTGQKWTLECALW